MLRRKRTIRRDLSGAASSVIAFMVAGVLFMGSVVAVLYTTRSASDRTVVAGPQDNAAAVIQSSSLADVLLDSPGVGVAGADWASGANLATGNTPGADGIGRLGLLNDPASPDPTYLSYPKFQNLRRAPLVANSADGYVNYQEAVQDLGLSSAGLDFHVRAYPSLDSVKSLLAGGRKDPNLRVTYVGHYDVTYPVTVGANPNPVDGLDETDPVCTISNDVSVSPGNTPPAGNPSGAAQNYRLQVTVTNGGQTTTQFQGTFTYTLKSSTTGATYSGDATSPRTSYTYLVAPNEAVYLYTDIPARPGVDCGVGSTISVKIQDPVGNTVTKSTTLTTAVTGATYPAEVRDMQLEPGNAVYTTASCASNVQLNWLSPTTAAAGGLVGSNDWLAMKIVDANGVQKWPASGYTVFKGNTGTKSQNVNACLNPGQYRAYLYFSTSQNGFSDTSEHVVRRILVGTGTPSAYQAPGTQTIDYDHPIYTAAPPIAQETYELATIVDKFCPSFYNSKTTTPLSQMPAPAPDWDGDLDSDTSDDWRHRCDSDASGHFAAAPADVRVTANQPGDVVPDAKKVMDNELPLRLLDATGAPRYDVVNTLVIGSDVSHVAMTSGAAKFAVRDWVLGGGNLIVFGSDAQNINWLEPLFHSAIRSSSGGISVPDASHPILHTPDELDNPAVNYDSRGQAWDFNGQTAQAQQSETTALFTNVIVQGGDALNGDPLLADSKPGAIGNGTIILSSYFPYDLYNSAKTNQPAGSDCPGRTIGQCEGMKFVHNLLMSGYADLYLDYGPEIPDLTDVQPSVHYEQIRHPQFADPIEMTLIVYVFRE